MMATVILYAPLMVGRARTQTETTNHQYSNHRLMGSEVGEFSELRMLCPDARIAFIVLPSLNQGMR
jgi:hypothetical protein